MPTNMKGSRDVSACELDSAEDNMKLIVWSGGMLNSFVFLILFCQETSNTILGL